MKRKVRLEKHNNVNTKNQRHNPHPAGHLTPPRAKRADLAHRHEGWRERDRGNLRGLWLQFQQHG